MNKAAPGSSAVQSSSASLDQRLDAGHDDRLEESLFGGEVTVDRPHADPGPAGHFVDGDGQALGSEHLFSRLEHFGPVAPGVGPERAQDAGPGGRGHPGPLAAVLSLSCVLTPGRQNNSVDKRNDRSVY